MKKLIVMSACAAALASSAMAMDVRTSGFVNVVGGVSDKADEVNGYDTDYDFQKDSLAAIQFNAKVADKMGAVIQLIAQKSDVDDDIRMEWGYVYYDATDELRILAGRIRPSLFLYSNYLDVGYAYTWITPPSEVYYQAQITNLDGGNISYNLELDDGAISINAYAGNTSRKKLNRTSGDIIDFSYDSVYGAEIAYTNDYMKIRAGYTSSKVTSASLQPAPVGTYLNFDDSSAAFYGVGASVDYEDIVFATEYIIRDMDETVAPDLSAYYAMLGYKIGDFTPNYTYSVADSDMEFATVAGTTTLADGTTKPTQSVVNGARAAQLFDRTSHTLGLRYDLNDAAALKFEYKHTTVTTSTYTGGTSLSETDEDINTYRVALNVVF